MSVIFITGNGWKHAEARRLMSGLDLTLSRVKLARGPSGVLEDVAAFRVRDGWRQLRAPCFVENTSLTLEEHGHFTGAEFKEQFLKLGEQLFARTYGGTRAVTRVVLAYTADGAEVETYEGQLDGQLLASPRGEGGYGWDRLFIPDGYGRTLAELSSAKDVVNMRQRPFLELACRLVGDGLEGIFESHVTTDPCEPGAFAAACERLGVKCVWIEQRGARPVQPMTAAFHKGTYRAALDAMQTIAARLIKDGFNVVRTKLEAVGRHKDIPQTDDAARARPKTSYFEHHVNVSVPEGTDLEALADACRALDGHLSKNARKAKVEGFETRFVTLRSWAVGQPAADARFERVRALLLERKLTLKNQVREYTVYDSALDVDAGWMT